MKIEYLDEFISLAKTLNFTETATLCNISQPTLSKHINSLERELKVPLFIRGGSSITLSPAGKLVLPHAYAILEERRKIDTAAKKGMGSLAPHITIGGNVSLQTTLDCIAVLARKFMNLYGVDIIELQDIEINPTATLDMSSENAPDFYFIYLDETDEIGQDSEARPVAQVPLSIVVNKNHRLASRDSVALADLKTEVFIKLEGNYVSGSWRFIESMCLQTGFLPNCKHVYFPRVTDFLKVTFQMEQEILVLTNDYIQQYHSFISNNCVSVPINDSLAFMPLSVVYSMSNANPLIDDALDVILNRNEKMDG